MKPLAQVRAMMCSAFPRPDRIATLPVAGAAGRVTTAPVSSFLTIPAGDIASRDGFAVVSGETLGAHDGSPVPLKNPCRVNTGNAIPPGYDAVVMIEDVAGRDGAWSTKKAVLTGEHIFPDGSEIRRGDLILPAGHRIRPCDIGALLSCGIVTVDVREVRVGLIPTGSELVPAGSLPGSGGAVESNTAVSAALLGEAGATCTRYGIVRDDPVLLREAIERGIRENDMLLISAGSSAGTRDFTAAVIAGLGEVLVHGIAMKPGLPAIVGRIDGKPVIGLPGHPASAFVVLVAIVDHLLAAMRETTVSRRTVRARLTQNIPSTRGREDYVRVSLGNGEARPVFGKSGLLNTLVQSEGLVRIPASSEGFEVGEEVEVILW